MTRKSLRTKRIFSIILSLAVALTMMPMSALAADGTSTVENAVANDGAEKYYLGLQDAFAGVEDHGTVTMLKPLGDKMISFCKDTNEQPVDKTVTLMMNGNSLSFEGAPTLYIQSGKLIIGDEATISQTEKTPQPAVFVDNDERSKDRGTLEFKGKANLTGGLLIQNWGKLEGGLKEGTIITSNDTYSVSVKQSTDTYDNVLGLLGDGLAFAKYNKNAENKAGAIVDGSVKQLTEDVIVVAHTHSVGENNKCACGFTCPHNNFQDGKCTICGNGCAHTTVDENGVCPNCKTQMVAKVEVGGTVTYSADFKEAMKNATNGTKITLLADVSIPNRTGISGDNTTVTLDLNGHKITYGWIDVGGKDTNGTYTACTLKIIGKGSYEPPMYRGIITVDMKATLDLSEWEGGTISSINISDNSNYEAATREAAVIVGPKAGTIGKLTFGNNQLGELKKTKLSGGSFHEIWVANHQPVKLGDLLVSGYALQHDDGSYEQHTRTLQNESIYNVKVVKCLHPNMKPDAATGMATCEYCGKSGKFVASVDGNLYTDMDAAVTDWLAKGGTLKLYADYTAATEKATWTIVSGEHSIDLNGHRMLVQGDGAFKPTNNMHLTVTDGTERGQIENILLDGSQHGSFTLESGYVGNLEMTGGAVVTLLGGRVDNLDVQNCSANTNLSIQGGSIGKLNIKDWVEGMHVSATGGSLGAYSLPSGKILADVLDHQYYAEGTSLDKQVDAAAQNWKKFDIKQAPHDFGSASKAANVPINGSIPFRVDSPSGDATGYYDVMWYRRTNSGAEHMTQNRVDGVKVGDKLDVLCVITGADRPSGAMKWQVAVKGYTINVVHAKLNDDRTVITQKPGTGNTQNPADNRLVVTPFTSNTFNNVEYKFEVTYNGQPLKLGEDYTIKDSSNRAMHAGTHTLTIVGIGNYTGEKSVTWRLEPYELSVENFRHAQITKTYDGTDAVTDSTNGIDALCGFIPDSNNPRNPIFMDNLNLNESDYQLSNMKFDSAEAGDRTFTGTMTLTPGGNFVFAGGSRVMQIEYGSVSGRVSVSINRASIAAPAAKALYVANNHAATYTVDLSALLPKLTSPMQYGTVTYALGINTLNSSYYDAGTAKIENGKLMIPIKAVETDAQTAIGTVTVTVSSTNFHNFDLTVNVSSTNKIVPTGDPTLSTKTLTYGQALSSIKLSGKLHDNVNNKDIEGTFTWVDGTVKPGAGSYGAEWKFTPADGDTYAETSGTVTITVTKATPTGTPKYTAITKEGQTLADANLTAEGENNESLFKALGKAIKGIVKWVESEDKTTALDLGTKVEQGKAYTWLFTPNEVDNYSTLTGTIVLWAKPSSSGGGAAPAPTPADADVITVKGDNKDNTNAKPGAETDTTITTKTTVKHTTTETTKNEQGQEVSKTTASVSKDLGDKLLDQAVSNKSDTIEITVKSNETNNNGSGAGASAADSVKATEVELPKATVNAIAKDTNADLVIKTDNGEVVLDNKTLETIAGAAKGDTVTIVVGENTQLKETQKPAEKIVGKNGTLFDLAAKIGERLLHQFEGGKAHVTLPMPEKLKGKDVLVIYIDDNGLCKILNHSVEKIGAEDYIRFTTTHFSTFAVVDKEEAEALIKAQNEAHVKELMQNGKFKVTTTKTSKKSVKVTVTAKNNKTLISDIKTMGYTVKYQFYRSTKKTSGYKLLKTKTTSSFTNTKGKKGTKYYYKAQVLVYDGKTLIAKSELKQASCGVRTWTK